MKGKPEATTCGLPAPSRATRRFSRTLPPLVPATRSAARLLVRTQLWLRELWGDGAFVHVTNDIMDQYLVDHEGALVFDDFS